MPDNIKISTGNFNFALEVRMGKTAVRLMEGIPGYLSICFLSLRFHPWYLQSLQISIPAFSYPCIFIPANTNPCKLLSLRFYPFKQQSLQIVIPGKINPVFLVPWFLPITKVNFTIPKHTQLQYHRVFST